MEAYPPPAATNGAHVTGSIGGGLWMVTSHTTQPKAAAALVQYMDTSPKIQENPAITQGLPAYAPDQNAWLKSLNGVFANPSATEAAIKTGRGRDLDRLEPRAMERRVHLRQLGDSGPRLPVARSHRRWRRWRPISRPRRRAPAGRSRASSDDRRSVDTNAMSAPPAPAVPSGRASARRGSRAGGAREPPPAGSSRTAGYFFVALYVGLLLLLGIAPAVYAIYLALSNAGGFGANFSAAFNDYRFLPGVRAHP